MCDYFTEIIEYLAHLAAVTAHSECSQHGQKGTTAPLNHSNRSNRSNPELNGIRSLAAHPQLGALERSARLFGGEHNAAAIGQL